MQWSDDGIVLRVKKHGEYSVLATFITKQHGKHSAIVKAGGHRKNRPVLQEGSWLYMTWKGRLSHHLGNLTVEPRKLYWSSYLQKPYLLHGMRSSLSLIYMLLPDHYPHEDIYSALGGLLESFEYDHDHWLEAYIRWEMKLLSDIGFGLDLSHCALTGATDNLAWVSPITGRAASYKAGLPWKNKLLPLSPIFLVEKEEYTQQDFMEAFRLTQHFLERTLREYGRKLPDDRQMVMEYILAIS